MGRQTRCMSQSQFQSRSSFISRNNSIFPSKVWLPHHRLLDEGGTVPFIARYRKEATGNLDEVQIRGMEEKAGVFSRTRRAPRNHSPHHRGTGQTHAGAWAPASKAALDKNELEDLYLPYKPKRRTKATIAREKGLEPLAQYLWPSSPPEGRWPSSPRHLSTLKKALPAPRKRSKARATSSPNRSAKMPTSAKSCAR